MPMMTGDGRDHISACGTSVSGADLRPQHPPQAHSAVYEMVLQRSCDVEPDGQEHQLTDLAMQTAAEFAKRMVGRHEWADMEQSKHIDGLTMAESHGDT